MVIVTIKSGVTNWTKLLSEAMKKMWTKEKLLLSFFLMVKKLSFQYHCFKTEALSKNKDMQ